MNKLSKQNYCLIKYLTIKSINLINPSGQLIESINRLNQLMESNVRIKTDETIRTYHRFNKELSTVCTEINTKTA